MMQTRGYNPFPHDTQEARQFKDKLVELYNDPTISNAVKYDFVKSLKKALLDYDNKYLAAVLFPETAPPCRIPSLFAMPTAIFTHRYHYYVNTGPNGQGWIAMCPQDTSFAANYQSPLGYTGKVNNVGEAFKYRGESDGRYISQNYAQVRLVGASMRVNYIGTQEQEAGFMVASHVFQSDLSHLSDEIIEDGYYVTRCRPQEGVRQIYLPKDNSDLEFWDTRFIIETNLASNSDEVDFNGYFQTGSNVADSLVVRHRVPNESTIVNYEDAAGDNIATANSIIGMGPKQKQGHHPQMLAVYWRGMTANQEWFRVDCERHFEGVPRTAIRDIVSVQKPVHDKKSLEAVQHISAQPQLVSHNTETGEHLKGQKTNIIDSVVSMGKQAIDFISGNASALGTAAQAIGTMTGQPHIATLGKGLHAIGGGAQIAKAHDMNEGHFGGESFTGGSTMPTVTGRAPMMALM